MTDGMQIGYNLQKLVNASDPMFIQCVRSAYLNLSPNQVTDFFRILLNHFSHRLHTKTGNEILSGICNVVDQYNYAEMFSENGYAYFLPFNQKQYNDQLLDLLYIFTKKVPNLFTERIAAQMGQICEDEPRKCLTLLSLYAQQFEKVHDPIPFLDLLFTESDAFRTLDCYKDYISLLVWLLRMLPRFKQERFQHVWTYLCDMLTASNPVILNRIYSGLCAVYEIDPDLARSFGYPTEAIACHIQYSSTQQSVLSLLIRFPPPPHSKGIEGIITGLTEIARTDEKGTLLLLQLAMEESNARILVENPQWMSMAIPRILDTLRLFGVVMLHDTLRPLLVESPSTIDFLLNLLQVNSVGVCNAVCTITKRLPLTPEFVTRLSQSGFLRAYLGAATEIGESAVRISALRLLDTLSRVRFTSEYLESLELVASLVKSGGELSLPAAAVATRLVRYPKCARGFGVLGLDKFFGGHFDDPRMQKYASKFLSVFRKIEK